MSELLVLFLTLLGASNSQVISSGPCPKVEVVKNFDIAAYLGTWYEQSRYFAIFEVGTKCISAHYSLLSNGSVGVLNKAINEESGNSVKIEGIANLVGNNAEGRLAVSFPVRPGAVAIYSLIGTDYKNWAAVYCCQEIGNKANAKFAWLLSRVRNPSEEVLIAANEAFAAQQISADEFINADQDNCPDN